MSHDLRTPLTSILGYIQLMEDDGISDEERKQYLRIAKDRTKRLQTLLNDFLNFLLLNLLIIV